MFVAPRDAQVAVAGTLQALDVDNATIGKVGKSLRALMKFERQSFGPVSCCDQEEFGVLSRSPTCPVVCGGEFLVSGCDQEEFGGCRLETPQDMSHGEVMLFEIFDDEEEDDAGTQVAVGDLVGDMEYGENLIDAGTQVAVGDPVDACTQVAVGDLVGDVEYGENFIDAGTQVAVEDPVGDMEYGKNLTRVAHRQKLVLQWKITPPRMRLG